ncbi:unnamed protein product, partial [Didymodactylos carnosus]
GESKSSKIVISRQLGGSGKSRLHFIKFNSRKEAKAAARRAGYGVLVHHAKNKEKGEQPHFHPTNGTHYEY